MIKEQTQLFKSNKKIYNVYINYADFLFNLVCTWVLPSRLLGCMKIIFVLCWMVDYIEKQRSLGCI